MLTLARIRLAWLSSFQILRKGTVEMPVNKSRLDGRRSSVQKLTEETVRRHEAEQLLNEIDNLAILLHEVRKQTDRIGAAADAIGDAVLSHLEGARMQEIDSQEIDSHNAKKTVSIMQVKSGSRLRSLVPRAFDIHNA
jgi:hypothetical protein